MNEKRFVCIDVGYGDDWYITDNGKRLSEMEIVDLLNEQQATIEALILDRNNQEEKLDIARRNMTKQLEKISEQQATIQQLQAKLREKEEDERLYANEILELRETNKEHIKFKSLGGNY